jgi:hypothetical protein
MIALGWDDEAELRRWVVGRSSGHGDQLTASRPGFCGGSRKGHVRVRLGLLRAVTSPLLPDPPAGKKEEG